MTHRLAVVLAVLSVVPAAAQEPAPPQSWAAQGGASWLRTRQYGAGRALSPRLSAIPDFTWETGPRSADGGARLREVEVALQAEADPYARVDIFLGFPGAGLTSGEGKVEVEEAYATATALPFGVSARGGKFLANFGRLNLIHKPERDQTSHPLVTERFLGEEGLNSVGAEVSLARALGGAFVEATYGLLDDLGQEQEERTVDVTAPNGTVVPVKVDDAPRARRRLRDLAHVAKLRAATDLTEHWTLDTGLSGAVHQPRLAEHRSLAGTDLTVRWKPLKEGLYKSFLWRTELMATRRDIRAVEDINTAGGTVIPGYRTHRRGAYSYAEYQWARRWRGGARLDYAEDPTATGTLSPTRAVSPYLTLTLSEFNRFRAEYQYRRLPGGADENRGTLQWTLVLGPHGAHPF